MLAVVGVGLLLLVYGYALMAQLQDVTSAAGGWLGLLVFPGFPIALAGVLWLKFWWEDR